MRISRRISDEPNIITPEYHFGEGIIRGNEIMYFEKDHLGSTRAVLNTSGTVIEKSDYYPFGLRHSNSSYALTHLLTTTITLNSGTPAPGNESTYVCYNI